jgi:hypothetical protein
MFFIVYCYLKVLLSSLLDGSFLPRPPLMISFDSLLQSYLENDQSSKGRLIQNGVLNIIHLYNFLDRSTLEIKSFVETNMDFHHPKFLPIIQSQFQLFKNHHYQIK